MYDIKYKKQQKWYEIRNIWGITEQEPRHNMRDEIFQTQNTRFLYPIWSEIQDLRFKTPKQYSSALTPTPPMSYDGITIFTPSWPITFHTSSSTPQPQGMSYERQSYGRKLSTMRLTILDFGQSILNILPVCEVLGVPRRLSIEGHAVTGDVNWQIGNSITASWVRTHCNWCWKVFAQKGLP